MEARVFDPTRMRLNKSGRAIWTDASGELDARGRPIRNGSFVQNCAPPALVPAPEVAPAPAPEVAGSRAPEVAPKVAPARAPEVASPAPTPAPDAALRAQLGEGPVPQPIPPPPESPRVSPAASEAPAELREVPAEGAGVPPPAGEWQPSEEEAQGFAILHEQLVNRFGAAYPRPYTKQERDDVAAACRLMLGRYGGGLQRHAPLVSFGAVTASVVMSRRVLACSSCGGGSSPEGARYCVECGTPQAAGGACRGRCGSTLPAGCLFCPVCGTSQAPSKADPIAPPITPPIAAPTPAASSVASEAPSSPRVATPLAEPVL